MKSEMSKKIRIYVWLGLFAISVGYLEAAVVSYLRELYCPGGFSFPLSMPPIKIFLIELGREASTIVMLLAPSMVIGSSLITRLAYFCFLFGIWDISYYFWLYVLLKWPASLFTWDILFSIPISWAAPVIAPVIVSFLLIGFSIVIFYLHNRGCNIKIFLFEKTAYFISLLLIFLSMTLDAFLEPRIYLYRDPVSFHWGLFSFGALIFIIITGRVLWNSLLNFKQRGAR